MLQSSLHAYFLDLKHVKRLEIKYRNTYMGERNDRKTWSKRYETFSRAKHLASTNMQSEETHTYTKILQWKSSENNNAVIKGMKKRRKMNAREKLQNIF